MKYIKNCFWSLIPARSKSKTIKNKNLLKINNKSLIEYSVEASIKSKYISKTFFSSDSKKYLKIAKKAGCNNLILRAQKYSRDKTSDLEMFKDFIFLGGPGPGPWAQAQGRAQPRAGPGPPHLVGVW